MAQQVTTTPRKRRTLACASALVAGTALFVLCSDDVFSPSYRSASSFRGLVRDSNASPSSSISSSSASLPTPPIDDDERGIIFYNVFVPPDDPEGRSNALNVVREQMAQLDASGRARTMPVRYGLIGDESASSDIETICRGTSGGGTSSRDCSRAAYHEKGNEWVTLQPLYEYCGDNPTKWATYIHNKGSFHPSPENDIMRRMITKAALSDECQTVSADSCNVCSNRFTPLPFLHTSGNHWTASCEYVRKLIPPVYFYPAMEEILDEKVDHVLSWANNGQGLKKSAHHGSDRQGDKKEVEEEAKKAAGEEGSDKRKARTMASVTENARRLVSPPKIYTSETFLGRGRFAMEHWILSHPQQKPCDVYPGTYAWGHSDLPPPPGDDWIPELQRAPRFDTLEQYMIPPFAFAASEPWFCGMESRLFEFDKLYGETPFLDSWIWPFYERSKGFCQSAKTEEEQQGGAT